MLKHPILLPIALLLFLALLTFWINQTVQEQGIKVSTMGRHDPDYLLYDFVSTRTNQAGHTVFALAATQMRHFPDNDMTELQRPHFTRFGDNRPTMQIQSQRGMVSSRGESVTFLGQVKVVRQAYANQGEMQLSTQKLIIEPETEIAHTDQPVVIRQLPATVITATGMRADHKANTVQLFNRVHVHYQPARVSPATSVGKRRAPVASRPSS